MIRLGSLAGYPFEGPRLLAGWTPPEGPGVYAVLYRPDPGSAPERYAVIDVDHADDLSAAGLPFRHPRSPCWVRRAGGRWSVHVAVYEVPGGSRGHRELITSELCSVYRPGCSEQQFRPAWEEHWIGSYSAPTTGPLGTGRDPDAPSGS